MFIPNLRGILTEIQIFYISFCHPGKVLWGIKNVDLFGLVLWFGLDQGSADFGILAKTFRYIYVFIGTQPLLFVHVLSVCFPAILAELSSCDRDQRAGSQSLKYFLPAAVQKKLAKLCCSSEVDRVQGGIG